MCHLVIPVYRFGIVDEKVIDIQNTMMITSMSWEKRERTMTGLGNPQPWEQAFSQKMKIGHPRGMSLLNFIRG